MKDAATIAAIATPPGIGALGIIRLSGTDAISIAQSVWKGKPLKGFPSHSIHYGKIVDGQRDIDEVMLSLFRAPRSFTTEDMVELSCHGSSYILDQILRLLLSRGARLAEPGEFTMRAFLNGRIDLSQAEAVADLIAAGSAFSHELAMRQLRGGFALQIRELRSKLLNLASMLELELDFSEEEVQFVNRNDLSGMIEETVKALQPLIDSFSLGNVVKHGVNTVIAGKPNAGKSTLLNALLNEERAIVSHIEGTTRDTIEEVLNIDGILFRFIDTAGLRHTDDKVEAIGVQRSIEKIKQADLVVYLYDIHKLLPKDVEAETESLNIPRQKLLVVANKTDLSVQQQGPAFLADLMISAKEGIGLDALKRAFVDKVIDKELSSRNNILTNIRHYEALAKAKLSFEEVRKGIIEDKTTELIAFDLRAALEALGEISGEVTNDEILGNIFSKFCIGK